MSVFRNSAFAVALLLMYAPAHAQDVSGEPSQLQNAAPETSASPSEPGSTIYRQKPSVLGTGGEAPVSARALGTVEGPLAGTLDDSNGGLGRDMWLSSERGAMEAMLQQVSGSTPSPSERALLRSLLLTTASPPEGPWHTPFLALRIRKLLEAGMLEDAASLASQIQNSTNAEIVQAQAEALLYAGRDDAACSDTTSYRLQDATPFWLELRAFCYAVSHDAPALELTRAVMDAQQIEEPAFAALLNALIGKKQKTIAVSAPNVLHVRLYEKLNLPLTVEMASISVPASVVALRAGNTPPAVRLAAAERAFRAGALSAASASQFFGLSKFKAEDLAYAATLALSEAPIQGLSRLKAALKVQTNPGKRAELVYTALKIGEREGLFAPIAAAFHDEAASLAPSPDWSNWSAIIARGLLIAGDPDAAHLWFEMINQRLPQLKDTINELALIFALGAPNEARNALAQASLSWLVEAASGPQASTENRARAALYLGLFDALGRPLSPALQARVPEFTNAILPGRRPARAIMMRIETASLGGRRGEAVLAIIAAMGPAGPAGLAPDITVRLVRALQTLGLHREAQSLAAEAVIVPATQAQG